MRGFVFPAASAELARAGDDGKNKMAEGRFCAIRFTNVNTCNSCRRLVIMYFFRNAETPYRLPA
jgi:hypothetical protein